MEPHEKKEVTRDEIKKEFQLERMILFSDAVFAIVITLMAMEIKLPQTQGIITAEMLPDALLHLLPVLFAYAVSFVFIGSVWYQHLKMFSLLKDYNKGLVVRNLLLLFFVGLFPFSASVITQAKGASAGFLIYMGVIMLCIFAQYVLFHYILIKSHGIRLNTNIDAHLDELYRRKVSLIGFSIATTLTVITRSLISDPEMKPMATLWIAVFPVVFVIFKRKKDKEQKHLHK